MIDTLKLAAAHLLEQMNLLLLVFPHLSATISLDIPWMYLEAPSRSFAFQTLGETPIPHSQNFFDLRSFRPLEDGTIKKNHEDEGHQDHC